MTTSTPQEALMSAAFKAFRTVPEYETGAAVDAYQIISTDLVVFRAMEPTVGHSTLGHVRPFGDDGPVLALSPTASRPLPASIDALPYDRKRVAVVTCWHDDLTTEARNVVESAWPTVTDAVKSGDASWSNDMLLCNTETARRIVGVDDPTVERYFAVPTHYTIGDRHETFAAAAEAARGSIVALDGLDRDSRAFIDERTITPRDNGSADEVARRWEVYRDGTTRLMHDHTS